MAASKWKKWSATDDADLWAAIREGVSEEDIALSVGRTVSSVKRRVSLLRNDLAEIRIEADESEAALAAKAEKMARDRGPSPHKLWLQAMLRIGRQQPN